jgi:iron complex outermembrane receptor protein
LADITLPANDFSNTVCGTANCQLSISRDDEADVFTSEGVRTDGVAVSPDSHRLGWTTTIAAIKNSNHRLYSSTNQSGDAFSPRAGIVYQPLPPISLYASYSRSFNPVTGTAFDRSSFQPERATQYEVGVKADLSNRLSATLAFYDLTRSNVLTTDTRPGVPSAPSGNSKFKIQNSKLLIPTDKSGGLNNDATLF